jgi:hypothetical protein
LSSSNINKPRAPKFTTITVVYNDRPFESVGYTLPSNFEVNLIEPAVGTETTLLYLSDRFSQPLHQHLQNLTPHCTNVSLHQRFKNSSIPNLYVTIKKESRGKEITNPPSQTTLPRYPLPKGLKLATKDESPAIRVHVEHDPTPPLNPERIYAPPDAFRHRDVLRRLLRTKADQQAGGREQDASTQSLEPFQTHSPLALSEEQMTSTWMAW